MKNAPEQKNIRQPISALFGIVPVMALICLLAGGALYLMMK